jgi:hypothetical protein
MTKDAPYSNREIDMKFQSIHDKMDTILDNVQKSREERQAFEKSVEPLFVTVSDNSGGIEELWKQNVELKKMIADNADGTKLIREITTSWKVGKAVVGFVISCLLFLVAVKTIINGGIKEGLLAIKNLIL